MNISRILNIKSAAVLIVFMPLCKVLAYPPDNAAVLYYQSFVLMQEDPNIPYDQIAEFAKGQIPGTEGMRKLIEKNRTAISMALKAATIQNCDWGIDYANWLEAPIPHLSKCRRLVYLISADVRFKIDEGRHKEALDECLLIYNISRHIGDGTIIGAVCSRSCESFANRNLQYLLPLLGNDIMALGHLDSQLAQAIISGPSSILNRTSAEIR